MNVELSDKSRRRDKASNLIFQSFEHGIYDFSHKAPDLVAQGAPEASREGPNGVIEVPIVFRFQELSLSYLESPGFSLGVSPGPLD